MNKNNVFAFPCYSWYRLDKHVPHFFKAVKYMFQRAARGYCDMDVWDIDCYLLDIIPNILKALAKRSQSYPSSFDELVGNTGEGYSEEAHQKWVEYLTETAKLFKALSPEAVDDQIELAFDELVKDNDEEKYKAAYAEIIHKRDLLTKKAFDELLKHFYELWW